MVAFDCKTGSFGRKTQDEFYVFLIHDSFATAEMPADKLDSEAALEHHARSFGIGPHIELSRGRDVSFTAGRASHDDAAANLGDNAGLECQSESKIGERSQSNDYEPRICFDGFGNSLTAGRSSGTR
jgi:hypothetical protein